MNIKEFVENIKQDIYCYRDFNDFDGNKLEDIEAIQKELERLWKIEECAHQIRKASGNWNELQLAGKQLDAALAAKE